MKKFFNKHVLLACAFVFGVCLSVSAQEDEYDYSFPVKYQGQRPTISDFVTAILSQEELGELLGSISEQWKLHRQGKKTEGEFTVNTKNGYIRYDSRYADEDGREEATTEFCYWNCSDNRHKLVAVNHFLYVNGRVVFTEHSGLMLYMYDSQTRRMTNTYPNAVGLEHSLDGPTTFSLPITGKDIIATVHPDDDDPNGVEKVVEFLWDGMQFHQEKSLIEAQNMNDEYDVSLRIVDADGESPGYEAIFRLNGKAAQVLEARVEDRPSDMEKFGNVIMEDVNFDGYGDLLICLGGQKVSDQTFMHYDAWIATPADGTVKFTRYKNFRGVANAEVDTENKRILSHYLVRDGVTYNYTAHRWKNGMLMVDGQSWNEKKKLMVK